MQLEVIRVASARRSHLSTDLQEVREFFKEHEHLSCVQALSTGGTTMNRTGTVSFPWT